MLFFLCGIASIFKLCFDIYEYISDASHERPFHRKNILFCCFYYMLLILLRCFFLMILGF